MSILTYDCSVFDNVLSQIILCLLRHVTRLWINSCMYRVCSDSAESDTCTGSNIFVLQCPIHQFHPQGREAGDTPIHIAQVYKAVDFGPKPSGWLQL
jgi:hypothetical protein